jgi:ubiquinone/menaquinone biosynthesis C-methylase UbiE
LNHSKLIRKFDKQAAMYEARRKRGSEQEWRRKLLAFARGRVLEVGVGAGANFPYYPEGVHVTAADFSAAMLEKARDGAAESSIQAEFVLSDIETLSFPDDSFDTIVSTLTLCGYNDPLRVLRHCNRWCKKEGRILLMEHGKSSNPFVGNVQTAANPLFKRMVGCNLNRDITGLVRSAGLQIERIEAHMLQMVHLIWAKPVK